MVHPELEGKMAGEQGHPRKFGDIPGADKQPARAGIALNLVDHPRELVYNGGAVVVPVTSLRAIHRAKLAILIGPWIPDMDAVAMKGVQAGLPGEHPEQLIHDSPDEQPLGGQQREARRQVEPELMPEAAQSAGARALLFPAPMPVPVPSCFRHP